MPLPFGKEVVARVAQAHDTPFYLYDADGIAGTVKTLLDTIRGNHAFTSTYVNYFAVKALPNPSILRLLLDKGLGFDCSSLGELLLCERVGAHTSRFPNGLSKIMFTSNNTPPSEFKKAAELGAIINFDDVAHLDFFEQHVGKLPSMVSFRYNPGALRNFGKDNNFIIGQPVEAKFGCTKDQIIEGISKCKSRGVSSFGLHTMLVSNELNAAAFVETAQMLLDFVVEIHERLGVDSVELINLGGGFGINYRRLAVAEADGQPEALDLAAISRGIARVFDDVIARNDHFPSHAKAKLNLATENGRFVTGPHGYLITKVVHKKHTYKTYVGVDATMANLMRPGMYGAYHHISNLSQQPFSSSSSSSSPPFVCDVVGSLCENNDKFAVDRQFANAIQVGDILVIHDSGAHGSSMGFQYNAKLRCAEFMFDRDAKTLVMVRRKETYDDLFATLVCSGKL